MLGQIKIREFGAAPRNMLKVIRRVLKEHAWPAAGKFFHLKMRDDRFTVAHARKAQYALRKGELDARGSKSWARSYTGRKFRKFGHTRPLEFTGETRRAVGYASISATAKGASVRYPGARKFNYRNPFSNPSMNLNLEFRKIIPEEANILAKVVNFELDAVNRDNTPGPTITI